MINTSESTILIVLMLLLSGMMVGILIGVVFTSWDYKRYIKSMEEKREEEDDREY